MSSAPRMPVCTHKNFSRCSLMGERCCACIDPAAFANTLRAREAAPHSRIWAIPFCDPCKDYWNLDSDQALGHTAADNSSPGLLAHIRESFLIRHSLISSSPLAGFRSNLFPRESSDDLLNVGAGNDAHERAPGSRHPEQLMPGNFPNNGPEIRNYLTLNQSATGGSGSGLDDSDDSDDIRSLENNIPSSSNGSSERRSSNLWSLSNSAQGSEAEMPYYPPGPFTRPTGAQTAARSEVTINHAISAHRSTNEGLRRPRNSRDTRGPHEAALYEHQFRGIGEPEERAHDRLRSTDHTMPRSGLDDDDDSDSLSPALSLRTLTAYNRTQQRQRSDASAVRNALESYRNRDPHHRLSDNRASPSRGNPDDGAQGSDRVSERVLRLSREILGGNHNPYANSVGAFSRWRGFRRPPGGIHPDYPPPAEPKGLDDDRTRPEPLEMEAMKLDCECKICFGQIADTLLLPCSHLAICTWCANQMGIRPSSELHFGPPTHCPVCRVAVSSRVYLALLQPSPILMLTKPRNRSRFSVHDSIPIPSLPFSPFIDQW
ncbi:unnamed protein product [Tuber aestivum]|uniref:RING-type domain-containing protein n=1 Tax=Tuber aestivum TaxID=59557 RepID=A0A292PJY1_9PEZI|nr:unnamed protein product [Tuber aestivum]